MMFCSFSYCFFIEPNLSTCDANETGEQATEKMRVVVVSEYFLEDYSDVVSVLSANHHIICQDYFLLQKVHIIINDLVAVVLLRIESVCDKLSLKDFLKTLIESSFCFRTIWVILLVPFTHNQSFKLVTQLAQATVKFECNIILRICSSLPADLAQVIHIIYEKENLTYTRNTSVPLFSSPRFLAQCDFCQRFPFVNLRLAYTLLDENVIFKLIEKNHTDLKQLPEISENNPNLIRFRQAIQSYF
jgi:hypothetical protein